MIPRFLLFIFFFAFTFHIHGQGVTYRSSVESQLEITRLTVLPSTDNVGNIYASVIEKHLVDLVQNDHRWNYEPLNFAGPTPLLDDLEQNPDFLLKMTQSSQADSAVGLQMTKGPKGISLKLSLFQLSNGYLLAQVQLRNHKRFDLPDIKNQTTQLFAKLIHKIPYQGRVISRQANRLTINLGKKDGIQPQTDLNVIQITRVDRHPRFNFIVGAQKEILGKIKILKVEDTLSFASIIYERERGVIRKGHKIDGLKNIKYTVPDSLSEKSLTDTESSLKNEIVFGKDAKEWLPTKKPTFGQVGVKLGLGTYNGKVDLASESLQASDSIVPQVGISGEVWINPNWLVRFQWEQSIASTENPRTGSSPESLSHSLSAYSLIAGYSFLLEQEFFGPKIELGVGFSGYSDSVDTSNPTAFTTMKYSGLTLALRGQMPINEKWSGGLSINYVLGPSLSESPETSGTDSSPGVTDFKIFASYKLKTRLRIVGDLNFRLLKASFTGTGTRGEAVSSASQTMTTLSGGIAYLF